MTDAKEYTRNFTDNDRIKIEVSESNFNILISKLGACHHNGFAQKNFALDS